MPFLSIIVPCYMNEDILKLAIPSIERQTSMDYELILIDDKSPNDLYGMMLKYISDDKCRIKNNVRLFINAQNMGPGATRNRGIELAQGDYILFLDDDDYLEDDAVEGLKNAACGEDVILYDFQRIVDGKRVNYNGISNKMVLSSGEHDNRMTAHVPICNAIEKANFSMCSKIYRREFLIDKEIRMPNLLLGEDYVFTKLALASSDAVSYFPKSIYVIVDNKGSLTKINPLGEFANEQYEYIKENWPKGKNEEALTSVFIYLKCFTKVWNMIEHGVAKESICKYIDELDEQGINWKEDCYIREMPRYQRIFVEAVAKKRIAIMKIVVGLRVMAKKVYR